MSFSSFVSPSSLPTVAKRSKEEKREGGRQVLFPIRVDDSVLTTDRDWAYHLRKKRNIGNWAEWDRPAKFQALFARMLQELKESESNDDSQRESSAP